MHDRAGPPAQDATDPPDWCHAGPPAYEGDVKTYRWTIVTAVIAVALLIGVLVLLLR